MPDPSQKIAIVVQRCHPEALGGSEGHAWQYALLLKKHYQVEVLTSCAVSATTWAPEIPPGLREEDGILVRHFANWEGHTPYWKRLHGLLLDTWRRHVSKAGPCVSGNGRTFGRGASLAHLLDWPLGLQMEWVRFQGPHSPDLLYFLQNHHDAYKKIFFITYLYSPVVFGLPLVPREKSLFVPTLHDEPPAWLSIYRNLAHRAGRLLWNTKAERRFGELLWGRLPGEIVSMGIEPPRKQTHDELPKLKKPYLLYLGRIDAGKGCAELIDFVLRYNQSQKGRVFLYFAGVLQMKLPKLPWLSYLGFVSEEEKEFYIQNASVLVMPSLHESLSLVTLEAMANQTPVLVQAENEVLREHVETARCGRGYRDFETFAQGLSEILRGLSSEELQRGRRYVQEHYSLGVVQRKLLQIVESNLT